MRTPATQPAGVPYEIFSDGARSGSEPSITRAFETARSLADRGAADVRVVCGPESWHWVKARGFVKLA